MQYQYTLSHLQITPWHVRYEVLTAMLLMIQDVWDVTLCHWTSVSQHFEGSLYLHHQGQEAPKVFLNCSILKMKALLSTEMPRTTPTMTQCHIQKTQIINTVAWMPVLLMNVVLPGILFILYLFNDNVYRNLDPSVLNCY